MTPTIQPAVALLELHTLASKEVVDETEDDEDDEDNNFMVWIWIQ